MVSFILLATCKTMLVCIQMIRYLIPKTMHSKLKMDQYDPPPPPKKNTRGKSVCSGRVSSSCSTSDTRHHDLINCYGICGSNIHYWYVPFVIVTIPFSFPLSWLNTGLLPRVTLVETELPPLPEHLVSSIFC